MLVKDGPVVPVPALLPELAPELRTDPAGWFKFEGVEGLTPKQVYEVTLAAAYAMKVPAMTRAVTEQESVLSADEVEKVNIAAQIMAAEHFMHRSLRLIDDADFASMRSHLRMKVLLASGIPKIDFEGMALAIATVRGCERSIETHLSELVRYGASRVHIQSVAAVTSVVMAGAHLFQFG